MEESKAAREQSNSVELEKLRVEREKLNEIKAERLSREAREEAERAAEREARVLACHTHRDEILYKANPSLFKNTQKLKEARESFDQGNLVLEGYKKNVKVDFSNSPLVQPAIRDEMSGRSGEGQRGDKEQKLLLPTAEVDRAESQRDAFLLSREGRWRQGS